MRISLKSKKEQIRTLIYLLLFVFILFASTIYCKSSSRSRLVSKAETEFNNGNYLEALDSSIRAVAEVKNNEKNIVVSQGFDIMGCSQILLTKYAEAEKSFNQSLQHLPDEPRYLSQKALTYVHIAWLYRYQYKFDKSLEFSKKSVALDPQNKDILGEHYLNIGRIFFSKGFDLSSIIWLEKAEKVFENKGVSAAKLETFRYLFLTWQAKLNYPAALKYSQKLISAAQGSRFKFIYRRSLLDLANVLNATKQSEKGFGVLEKGLQISTEHGSSFHTNVFLSQLLLNCLYNEDLIHASDYLDRLDKNNKDGRFSFDIKLGKAIMAAFENDLETSEKLFAQLEIEDVEKRKTFPILYWKITIAEKFHNSNEVIRLNQQLLDISLKNNFRDDLPGIFLTFAKANFNLKQNHSATEYLEKSLAYIEDIRKSANAELSLSLFETYHDAYRLFSEIKSDTPEKAFELSDFLKSRFLRDKLSNSGFKESEKPFISSRTGQRIEKLSSDLINGKSLETELAEIERDVTKSLPELNISKLDLDKLKEMSDLNNVAIVSYLFTIDKKLLAFVWQKNEPLQSVYLPVNEDEINKLATGTFDKLKHYTFFKRDGKMIFDKLLRPLSIKADHLIIIPDKSLWRIPFQISSEDGKKYLIEARTISYAPSVSILSDQLSLPKPNRQTFQVFSNNLFNNLYLEFADAEAISLARFYNTQPHLNSTETAFRTLAPKSDIIHFSMHAKVNSSEPFNSFLAFKKTNTDSGQVTVGELLKMKLKKGSLAFLASCNTNNIFNGEGLVSLSWGMMGAGASTVISAQWEANDKSTGLFTKAFYKYYKQGFSAAKSIQKASIEMINNDNDDINEPYHWAEFILNGDYR